MWCTGHYSGAQDTWTSVPFEGVLAAQRVKEPCLTWQSWGAARAKHTDPAHWVDNIGRRCPRALHVLIAKLLAGVAGDPLAGVSPDSEEEDILVFQGSPDPALAVGGLCPPPVFSRLFLALATLAAPLGAVPGCCAGLDGGCCADPAPLPALISLWKSRSLLLIQLWFWGQPSPSPSLSLSSSLLLLSFLLLSLPPLRTVLSGGSGYRCSITSHLHPGGWERVAEGEGCGGQVE